MIWHNSLQYIVKMCTTDKLTLRLLMYGHFYTPKTVYHHFCLIPNSHTVQYQSFNQLNSCAINIIVFNDIRQCVYIQHMGLKITKNCESTVVLRTLCHGYFSRVIIIHTHTYTHTLSLTVWKQPLSCTIHKNVWFKIK